MHFSRGDLLALVIVLSLAGIVDSAYLAWQWYASASAAWCDLNVYFSCSRVRDSPYAAVAGVPTAWIGVAGFGALLVFAFLASRAGEGFRTWTPERWLLRFAIVGAVLGSGLTILEVVVIQAICLLCVIGFLLDLAIVGAAATVLRAEA